MSIIFDGIPCPRCGTTKRYHINPTPRSSYPDGRCVHCMKRWAKVHYLKTRGKPSLANNLHLPSPVPILTPTYPPTSLPSLP